MSLTSKAQAYDTLVRELFNFLKKDSVVICCHREIDRERFNKLLKQLEDTLEDFG